MQQIDGVLHHWPMQGEDPLLLRLAGADPLVSLLGADTPGAGRQQSAKSRRSKASMEIGTNHLPERE